MSVAEAREFDSRIKSRDNGEGIKREQRSGAQEVSEIELVVEGGTGAVVGEGTESGSVSGGKGSELKEIGLAGGSGGEVESKRISDAG